MTAIALKPPTTRTGGPGGDDDRWLGYAWMAIFAVLLILGYLAIIQYGGA